MFGLLHHPRLRTSGAAEPAGAGSAVVQPPPLTMEESIRTALASNTDVRRAEEQVTKARAVTQQTRAGRGPQVSAGVTHSFERRGSFSICGSDFTYAIILPSGDQAG